MMAGLPPASSTLPAGGRAAYDRATAVPRLRVDAAPLPMEDP
jgi:hypothetical protein